MTRTLVTGANGHIGGAIVRALLKGGRQVRALVRRQSNLRGLEAEPGRLLPGIELAYGDLLSPHTLRDAISGCQVVYHTAAIFQTRLEDESIMMKTNVEGTRNILNACAESNVKRVLYTSSVAAVGCSRRPDVILDESHWNPDPIDTYVASKLESEKLAKAMSENLNIPTVFLNPGTVLGAGDHKMTPSSSFVVLSMRRPSPVYFSGGHSYTTARQVAAAHLVAEEVGRIHERYILAGDNVSMAQFFGEVSAITGRRRPRVPIGHNFVSVVGWGVEISAKIMGRAPLFTRKKAHKLIDYYGYFDSSKAKRELQYRPEAFRDILAESYEWYKEKGWI